MDSRHFLDPDNLLGDNNALDANDEKAADLQPRNKRKFGDLAYHPSRDPANKRSKSNSYSSASLFHTRADSRKTFVDETGNTVAIKTATLIESTSLPKEIIADAHERFKSIDTNRPVDKVTVRSGQNSPLKVITPNKTQLTRTKKVGLPNGAINLYSNAPQEHDTQQENYKENIEPAFYQSESYKSVAKIVGEINKIKVVDVTQEMVKETRKEKDSNLGRRVGTQHQAMASSSAAVKKVSATKYALAAGVQVHNIPWEYAHLVMYTILGALSQTTDNLCATTKFCNTDMMALEAEVLEMLKNEYSEGFTLNVKANIIPNTHIATSIEYGIVTDDFELPFTLNAQTIARPHVSMKDYVHEFMSAVINYYKPTTPKV